MPERIVFYRDGVGEGQLAAVVEHEIPQLLTTFSSLGRDYKYGHDTADLYFIVYNSGNVMHFFLKSFRMTCFAGKQNYCIS